MVHEPFRLFPDDKDASPGDALIQFLIEEQQKGNKRAKAVGKFFGQQMEKVFPNFNRALGDITSGSEERRQQLNEVFGFSLGETKTLSPGEAALGFGVGSIKSISGVKGLKSLKLGGKEIVKNLEPLGPKESIAAQADVIEAATGQQNRPQINAPPGTRPPLAFLEAQAIATAAAKQIQTRVKEVQKDLDRLAIAETNPLVPQSLVQQIAKKGLRAKASHEPTENTIVISFKSKTAKTDVNDEFAIFPTPDGPVLAINFNSPTIKSELRPKFKEVFPTRFLADEIGEEVRPGQRQRMAGETAKDAPPPDNFSYYSLRDFEDGLFVINRMLDIAKPVKKLSKKAQLIQRIADLRKELGGGSFPEIIAKARDGPKTAERVNLWLKLVRKLESFDEN